MGFAPAPSGGSGGGRVGAVSVDLTAESWAGGITADLSGETAATIVLLLPDAPDGDEALDLTMPNPATSSPFRVLLLADGDSLPLLANITPSSSIGVTNLYGTHEPTDELNFECTPIYSGSPLWLINARPPTIPNASYGSKIIDLSGETYPTITYAITPDDARYATLGVIVPAAGPGDTLEFTATPNSDDHGYFNLFVLGGGGGGDPGPEIVWPGGVFATDPYGLPADASVRVYALFPQPGGGWGAQRIPSTETPGVATGVGYDDTGNTYVTGATVAAALAAAEAKFVDLESRVAALEP